MFEGWAADVLASYLGKYLDLPRDRLRISLWGGEGVLEQVQLRVEAFEYLQLPFAIKEGCVGRLKLQIPWGRWRGGPLVVELSDVVLCVAPREESDWEEGPALRRAQAAKQAQLAAAELAKLGSRVAATGSTSTSSRGPQTAPAPAASGGGSGSSSSGASWALTIADYVLSFLLNRLQFAVKNVHVYFQAPENGSSEYEAFGVKLASLSTVAAGDAPSLLSLFPALLSASAAASAAAKVIRQLHVQGWSFYWKPRRGRMQHQQSQQLHGVASGHAAGAGHSRRHQQQQGRRSVTPTVEPQDYLLAPVEAVLQVTVNSSSGGSAAAGGGSSSSSAAAGLLSAGLACDVFLGAGQVGMQLSSQQLVGMARLADDAAVWGKRARYGRYRPPGWITVQQAALQGLTWRDNWQDSSSAHPPRQAPRQQEEQQPQQGVVEGAQSLARAASGSSSVGDPGLDELRSSSFSSAVGCPVVPTGRNGVGAPVPWRAVWQYAVQSVLADVRDKRRQQGCCMVQKSDLLARRRYVHVYQQKLDALQPKLSPAADVNPSADTAGLDKAAEGGAVTPATSSAATPVAAADASAAEGAAAAALQQELQRLEQQLCVEDILLCRSLAELALERRSSSSDAERCRSWFAWGASSITGYLYPSATSTTSTSISGNTPSKATPSKLAASGGGAAGATLPTEADLDELLELLHIRNSAPGDAVVQGSRQDAADEPAAALEAAQQAAGGRTTGRSTSSSKSSGVASSAVVHLQWQVLRVRAALQDFPDAGPKRELLVLDVEGTSITGSLKGGNVSAQLALQDVRLFDCCSDPGVHECVLQRLDPASPVAAVGGQLLSPSRAWGSGLTGLGLSQAQGLQRMSPEAFGWSGNAMPAVASGAHLRRAAAGAAGAAAGDGQGLAPALFTVSLQLQGGSNSKRVSVQLEPLQLLARPGILVAVNSMLDELPQDTLKSHLAAAEADIADSAGGTHASGDAAPAPAAAADSGDASPAGECPPGKRSVRFSEEGTAPPPLIRSNSPQLQPSQQREQPGLPPALLQLQLSFHIKEVLLVVPTELQYAAGTNAVLHLQGLRLAAAQPVASASPAKDGQQGLQYALSNNSSSSDGGGGGDDGGGGREAAAGQQLQQQCTLGLSSLFVGLHTGPRFHPEQLDDELHSPHHHQQQSHLQEVLKLPPVQGTVVLSAHQRSRAVPHPSSTAQRRRSSLATSQQQALVRVGLQVPPVSCCLTASLLEQVKQAAAALAWQTQLGLPQLVATYGLPVHQQLYMAAAAAKQAQSQQAQQGCWASSTGAVANASQGEPSAGGDAGSSSAAASSRAPSPTESEVQRWLSAPPTSAAAAAAVGGVDDSLLAAAAPQLRRCDSDKLLQSAASTTSTLRPGYNTDPRTASSRTKKQPRKQQQRLSQADAAAMLCAPEVLLLDVELLLEELDIQYVHDVGSDDSTQASDQQQQQQQGSPPHPMQAATGTSSSVHLRLQASLLSVGFKHSTHGSRAEAGLKDLVLQDMLQLQQQPAQPAQAQDKPPAPASAATQGSSPAVAMLRLISSVSVEELQVSWQRQLGQLACMQDLQVALDGLQAQGQPGDVGLFLLPASAAASSSISVDLQTVTLHDGAAASAGNAASCRAPISPRAAPVSTHIMVELQNIALGLDGLLHLAAAATSTDSRKTSSSSSTAEQSGPPAKRPASSTEAKPVVSLEVQLSQCQLLSCNSLSDGAGSATQSAEGYGAAPWQAADSFAPGWQPLHAGAAGLSQAVGCELLLDLPAVSFSLLPACTEGQEQPRVRPRLLLQDVAAYLPSSTLPEVLLPVLHIPRVLFTQPQHEHEQQQPGLAAVLAQQAECHRLLVPAVASSWRPFQLQHLVQLAGRQEQQWKAWTAAAKCGQQQQHAVSSQTQLQHQHPVRQHSQEDSSPQHRNSPAAKQPQQLAVEVGDVQLLLLPADGTSDKGMLLHWQQLQAAVLSNPVQPPSPPQAGASLPPADAARVVLQRTQVSWQELTVSAIQQDDHSSSAMQQQQGPFQADHHSGQLGAAGQQASEQQPQPQQAFYHAHDLPAVAWLSQGMGAVSRGKQRPSNQQGSGAGAAASRPEQAPGNNAARLSSHATLSRFLSTQESWRDAASAASSIDGSGFVTPRDAGSLRSTASWITARSSSLSAALSIQTQQQQQQQRHQAQQHQEQRAGGLEQPATRQTTGMLPSAAAVGPGSNIIAAWWQAEPPGQSPSGVSASWLQAASSWASTQQDVAGVGAAYMTGSGSGPTQQQSWEPGVMSDGLLPGRSPPAGRTGGTPRATARRSSSFRRSMPTGYLQLLRGSGHQGGGGPGSAAAASTHSAAVQDDGVTDADVEFYSIAGDSQDGDDAVEGLSPFGSPRSSGQAHGGGSGGVRSAAAGDDGGAPQQEEEAAWLQNWDLLSLPGFGAQGCQVAASWVLLSLAAAGATPAAASSEAGAQPPTALQLEVSRRILMQSLSGVSAVHSPSDQQRQQQVVHTTAVTTAGLALQLSAKHWDLVAACILQAANAASRPATVQGQQSPKAVLLQQQQQQQWSQHHQHHQQQQRPSQQSLLRLELQELQVVLFVPPDLVESAAPQPRTLLMRSSSGHSSRCKPQEPVRRSSGGYGPWQDPGSEPTTPTAATAVAGAAPSGHSSAAVHAVAGSGSTVVACAAQTVVLKVSVQADVCLLSNGSKGGLERLQVPAATVQLGAVPWDASTGQPSAGAHAGQQAQLLLLIQGVSVSAGGGSPDSVGRQGVLRAAARGARQQAVGQHLLVGVDSISGWVSTTRLSLLLNLQQHVLQQLPALTAAAAMAGPSAHAGVPPGAQRALALGGSRSEAVGAPPLAGAASLANGYSLSSSSSSSFSRSARTRSMEQSSAELRLVPDSSVRVAVQKVAVLVSTDEPEPWLLQQQQRLPTSHASSCFSSPERGGSTLSSFAAATQPHSPLGLKGSPAPAVPSLHGGQAAGYAALTTCSTPLLEVALLPLDIRLQVLKPRLSRQQQQGGDAAQQSVVQVDVEGCVRADVYSVGKLGWEPVLDPWTFKVAVCLSPSTPAGSSAAAKRISASISSSEVMELTVSPSVVIASKQLQALAAAAKTWQGEQALTQHLLQHLAAPPEGGSLQTAAGANCWLLNETGAPLSYVVADAVLDVSAATAALGSCAGGGNSSSSSPVKPPAVSGVASRAAAAASAKGQAAHLVPVPLHVLDVAAAGYFGRFVSQADGSLQQQQPAPPGLGTSAAGAALVRGEVSSVSSGAVKRSQLLYVQTAGRVDVVGPVALSQLGCGVHPLRGLGPDRLSPGPLPGPAGRRSRHACSLVVEVSRHRYGGRLVSVHSNMQMVNSSGITLQLGYLSPMGLSAQPLLLATLAPGDTIWMPLQVLQATTPSLCLRPAGLPCGYNWCQALDVYTLLPNSSSTAATSGFWYEPAAAPPAAAAATAAAPKPSAQFVSFAPQAHTSSGTSGRAPSGSLLHSPGAMSSPTAAAAAAAVGSLVLSLGASARPWPAGVAVQDAHSTGVSHGGSIYSRSSRAAAGVAGAGSSGGSTLWQLVVEPPAVLVNQLPVAVEVSVLAGKGDVRGLAALLESRQPLPLYGCEAAHYSKLKVQVPGFHSSMWIPLNTTATAVTGGPGTVARGRAAAAARYASDPGSVPLAGSSRDGLSVPAATAAEGSSHRHSDASGGVQADASGSSAAGPGGGAVPDYLQLLEEREVVLAGLQPHQPPQALLLRTCRNKLTGCLTVTLSCSLWLFNCLGSQVAVRQAGSGADAAAPAAGAFGAAYSSVAFASSSVRNGSSNHQVLWLPPYPWLTSVQGSSGDLTGLGAAAGTAGPPSLAAAWTAVSRADGAGGGSSRSALQRSRSTPSMAASMAGLEFLAGATPARQHAGLAGPHTTTSTVQQQQQWGSHQRRGSRGGDHSEAYSTVSGGAQAAAAASGLYRASPFAAAACGAGATAADGVPGSSGALPPPGPQQEQQEEEDRQVSVRRSFSASAVPAPLASPTGQHAAGAGQPMEPHVVGGQQAQQGSDAAVGEGSSVRNVRTRRHSSGLHMLASGKLPQQLLPPLQVPVSGGDQAAGTSSFDLLSPTHQQRLLQQLQLQQAVAAAAATVSQLPQSASAGDLAQQPGGSSGQSVVMPLMRPDMTGWLPLLAGGDLHQLSAAAVAFAAPAPLADVPGNSSSEPGTADIAWQLPRAAMQQRVAAAAAAADQLLANMPAGGRQQHGLPPLQQPAHDHHAVRRPVGSPPSSVTHYAVSVSGQTPSYAAPQGDSSSVGWHGSSQHPGRPASYSGHSHFSGSVLSQQGAPAGPGLAGLASPGHMGVGLGSQQQLYPPPALTRRPSAGGSWSGAGFADLAAAAAATAGSSTDAGYHHHRGPAASVAGAMTASVAGYAASHRSTAAVDAASSASSTGKAAAPAMCGWQLHLNDGSVGSKPGATTTTTTAAAAAAAAAGRTSGFIELQLCAAPAALAAALSGRAMQQLASQWSLPTKVPLLASQGGAPGPCSIVKLPLSLPGSSSAATSTGAASAVSTSSSAGPATGGGDSLSSSAVSATAAVRKKGASRSRGGAAEAGQQEQGACFVSVHTAAVPGGGGAWAVHLLPTYLLVNTLSCEVQLRQYDSELVLQTVAPGGHCCVLWPNAALPLKLQFRVDEPGWSWSGAASVDAPGEFLVKIRHRNRGETLLLQLDVAASSSGIVATLSGRQGGFAPYRIDNCSAEVLHVQQAGCPEQEDVLRPYSSLPYAWDEPSMPHKVLLFLAGHRPLGEFALERVGQVRRVAIPSSSRDHLARSHSKRLLLITTYAEGPMRVLRVLDTHSHLLQQPTLPAAVSGLQTMVVGSGLDAFGSRGSFASIAEVSGLSGYPSSSGLSQHQQQQGSLSRPSSTSSLQAMGTGGGGGGSSSSKGGSSAPSVTPAAASQQLTAKNRTLRLLSVFLSAADSSSATTAGAGTGGSSLTAAGSSGSLTNLGGSSNTSSSGGSGSGGGALKITAPSLDVRLLLDGLGVSLVSDTRELLYSSVRGMDARFCQDALRNAVGAAIASMRVENTLYGCQYPLMLASPVTRSVFGVVYPPGLNRASVAAAATPGAAEAEGTSSDDGGDAPASAVAAAELLGMQDGRAGAPHSGTQGETTAAVAASAIAAVAAAADAVGLDAQSIAHAVADELQLQEQGQTSGRQQVSDPAAASAQRQPPSRSSSQKLKQQEAGRSPAPPPPLRQQPLQVLQPHHVALAVLATVWRTQPSGVVCVEQLGLHLSPLALSLEGKHLKQLTEFAAQVAAAAADASGGGATAAFPARKGHSSTQALSAGRALAAATGGREYGAAGGSSLQQAWAPVQPPTLPTAAAAAASRRLKLYFEEWFVSAITLCVSFAPGSWFDPSPAGLASAWSASSGGSGAAAAVAAAEAAAAAAAAQEAAGGGVDAQGASGSTPAESSEGATGSSDAVASAAGGGGGGDASGQSGTQQQDGTAAADAGAAVAAVAAAASSPLPVYLQMALALAHAEEGAWLTLSPFSSTHTMINTESLVQVLGRHYILAAYQELPKVLASLDIFGDPARLLQALGLGFWNLVTLPAHSARWGPYRSLQRLLRGMRVMAYGVSNSIAKGSKRSKAALLPLAPEGLSWQQQHQQPPGGGWSSSSSGNSAASRGGSSSLAAHRAALEQGSMASLRSGSLRAAELQAGGGGGGSGSNQPGGGQDLLHVLVAGYSLTFQHLLHSFQSGQPLRGVVRAAAQTLVLPALLLLEMSESTASSFVRLLAEQLPGAVALRVPRYVAAGQLLRPYDRLESLGRALLHHTPGPFLREEFVGCVELQEGLYAVVTVGHLLLLACRTSAPAASSSSSAQAAQASSVSTGPSVQQQQQGEDRPQAEARGDGQQQQEEPQEPHQQQQRATCVQYKDPQLVFLLDLRDVMMVAAEGSSLRLLCMAGDAAAAATSSAVRGSTPGAAGGGGDDVKGAAGGDSDDGDDGGDMGNGSTAAAAATSAADTADGGGVDGVSTGGLRELLAAGGMDRGGTAARGSLLNSSGVPSAGVGQVASSMTLGSSNSRWQTAGSVASMTDTELESAAAGAAAAAAAAVAAGGGVLGPVDKAAAVLSSAVQQAGPGSDNNEVTTSCWGGCKWFVGHRVPCGDAAARQLQQLLERACQRVETLLASSAWPRQLML